MIAIDQPHSLLNLLKCDRRKVVPVNMGFHTLLVEWKDQVSGCGAYGASSGRLCFGPCIGAASPDLPRPGSEPESWQEWIPGTPG